MEDLTLKARIDEHTTLYVSTIAPQTYDEYVSDDNLGGGQGYFLIRTLDKGSCRSFEILAKSPSFDAAGDLFDMIVAARAQRELSNEAATEWY